MHCFWCSEPKKTQQPISTFASLSWNRSQWSLQCHGENFRDRLPDLYILTVSKWPTQALRRYSVGPTVASVSLLILILPVLSFTTFLHNREKAKTSHVRMDKLKHRNTEKFPTVPYKSVLKQEPGLSDIEILAGKIGVNTVGEASKVSWKPISEGFGKRTYLLRGNCSFETIRAK